jgi:hypothetical protein
MVRLGIEGSLKRECYVENLMREFCVSSEDARDYFHQNGDELVNLEHILHSEPEDHESTQKCLALIHILSHGDSYGMICRYYKKYERQLPLNKNVLSQITNYTIKYKLELLAALFYVISFYNKAREWYREIYAYPVRDDIESTHLNAGSSQIPHRQKTQGKEPEHIEKSLRPFVYSLKEPVEVLCETADGPGYAPAEFCKPYYVDDIDWKHCGKLFFLGNRKSGLLELRFEFINKEDPEQPINDNPFKKLDIEIFLNSDNNCHHTITLDKMMNSTICSNADKIDFISGFKFYEIIFYG